MASSDIAGHNASPQTGVAFNSDPALDISHEHHHSHLHHSANVEKHHTDNIVYSVGTTHEPSVIPDADPQDDHLRRRNHSTEKKDLSNVDVEMEKGAISPVPTGHGAEEEDPRRHNLSSLYIKFRPYVHVLIFCLFTG